MNSPWMFYAVVAVLGALVGVLVAGEPDLSVASATTATKAPESDATTSNIDAPDTAQMPDTTEAPTTTVPPATTERAHTTTVAPIPDRADISVVSANG